MRRMVAGLNITATDRIILENSETTKRMAKELLHGQAERHMLGSSRTTSSVEKVRSLSLTAKNTSVNLVIIK